MKAIRLLVSAILALSAISLLIAVALNFANIAVIAVSVTIIVVGWPAIAMLAEFDQRSQAADIPLVIPQALVPIGLGLNAILVAARLIGEARTRRGGTPATAAF